MLSEFVNRHRGEIIARCRARVAERMAPRPTRSELENGIPLFLRELEKALEGELRADSSPGGATAAVKHGGDLLRGGFTIAQVVHDYGDVCQTITELAIERNTPLSTAEFRALNRCLDNAIAEAVTEYARQHELDVVAQGAHHSNEHLGLFAHELRSLLASAMLAFDALRAGTVGIRGSTGDLLEHSLIGLRDLTNRSLTELRLTAGLARPESIAVGRFLEDVEVAAILGVHARRLRLTVSEVDPELVVRADREILSTVISNLVENAFKYTRPHTHVWLHTHATSDRLLFEIEDQCGGIPPHQSEHLLDPRGRHDDMRSGLAMCLRGVHLLGGAIRHRNQNHGCVFTVDLPLARLDSR
jgi:signal transduction histidine kinase